MSVRVTHTSVTTVRLMHSQLQYGCEAHSHLHYKDSFTGHSGLYCGNFLVVSILVCVRRRRWECASLNNGVPIQQHVYASYGVCFAIVMVHLGYSWLCKVGLGLGLGWSYSVFSVRLTHSYTIVVNCRCEAHSGLNYHCEAHSHLHYKCEAHSYFSYHSEVTL